MKMRKKNPRKEKRNLTVSRVSICSLSIMMHIHSRPNIESLYNEGKGIQITASLIGLVPQWKAGEKHRSNAKPPTTTKVMYIHKKMPFVYAVYEILGESLGWEDLCNAGGVDKQGHLLPITPFRLEYTIMHSTFKDIGLNSVMDWRTFMEEATKKAIPHGKLVIKEQMVVYSFCFSLASSEPMLNCCLDCSCWSQSSGGGRWWWCRLRRRELKEEKETEGLYPVFQNSTFWTIYF